MNEVLKTITKTITSAETDIETGGSEFFISSDVDCYIGIHSADFLIPAKTILGKPICAEKLTVKGSASGTVYILLLG